MDWWDEKEVVQMMSKAELLAIAQRDHEVRPDKSVDKGTLIEVAKGDASAPDNKVDCLRRKLMDFLEAKGDRVKIIGCTRNCYEHADGHVAACYHLYLEGEENV
jgi:hypothetical protein